MKETSISLQNTICQYYLDGYNGVEIHQMMMEQIKNIKTIYKVLTKYGLTRSPSEAKRQYSINHQYFDSITHPSQAYWLGFISGDGSINENNLIINISTKDEMILHQFNQDTHSNYPIHRYKTMSVLHITSNELVQALEHHNIVPRKTRSFNLSHYVPDHLLGSYLLGLNDADGCFSIDKKRGLRFSLVGTEISMQETQDILVERCQVNKNKLQKHHTTPYIKYLVYAGDKQLQRIANFLYQDQIFSLPRKHDKVKKYFADQNVVIP